MSAPERVRTTDGMVWERRAETRGGLALYAVEGAPKCCPPFVMATLAELAEHGVQSAELAAVVAELGALPVPAGPEPRDVEDELAGANLSLWEEVQAYARLRLALESAKRGRREMRARVVELEADNAALQQDKEYVAATAERRLSKADVAAWLRKKAREYPTAPERQESAAEAIARLADKVSRGAIRPAAAVESYADKLTRLLAPTQVLREDDEFGLHHSYRVSRDLPDAVAESVAEDRSWGGS